VKRNTDERSRNHSPSTSLICLGRLLRELFILFSPRSTPLQNTSSTAAPSGDDQYLSRLPGLPYSLPVLANRCNSCSSSSMSQHHKHLLALVANARTVRGCCSLSGLAGLLDVFSFAQTNASILCQKLGTPACKPI
jgi:hypothetical protein